MKKIIFRFLIFLISLFFLSIVYLTIFGIETSRFNNQIKNIIDNLNDDIQFELKKVKLNLEPLKLNIKLKTLGPKLKSNNAIIDIESIESRVSLNSLLNNKFAISNLYISTNSVKIRKLITFIRVINKNTSLLVIENFVKNGYLIADIKINFDNNGNIKDDYSIKGFVKDGKFNLLKKNKLDKVNFIFNVSNKKVNLKELELKYNDTELFFDKIDIQKENKNYNVKGEINNKNFIFKEKFIENISNFDYFKIKKIDLDLKSIFSFEINDKFRFNNLNIQSKADLNQLVLSNNFKINQFFPNIKDLIEFKKHKVEINFDKKGLFIKGYGDVLLQDKYDKINYTFKNKKNIFNFHTKIEIEKNLLIIDSLNFKNNNKVKTILEIKGQKKFNDYTKFTSFLLKDEVNNIEINEIFFNKNNKFVNLKKANFNYLDDENFKNKFQIINKDNEYFLNGKFINANKTVEKLLFSENDDKLDFFDKEFKLNIKIDKVHLDKDTTINNIKGNLLFKDEDIKDANLKALFIDNKKLKFTINSTEEEKITTLISENAKPFISRYKFIKGFDNGTLDYYSTKKYGISESQLKIYDFKLKELPVLTKVLSLASLQGIADLLTGEGIRFNEFEMNFKNENSIIKIDEIYAIGPAISIMMEGYVEKKKTVSLRGTLVPATTINKIISSIPLFGQILVGSKTGEGVFGVSFKIKGPPENLQTTVNPIKTLTPRFITRTLEKIKKN